jgi:hypothetical protein
MRHDQSVRIIEVFAGRLVQLVQLSLTGYASPGVSLHQVRVRQPALVSELAGKSDVGRVEVEPGHAAIRRYPFGQQVDDAAGAASQINRAPPRLDAYPVQERGTVAPEFFGLAPQPVAFRRAAA